VHLHNILKFCLTCKKTHYISNTELIGDEVSGKKSWFTLWVKQNPKMQYCGLKHVIHTATTMFKALKSEMSRTQF
jgi:hypothetical protein